MINEQDIIPALKAFIGSQQDVLFSYLYGSHAKGTVNRLSDVDVAVYLDESLVPAERQFDKRLELMGGVMSLLGTDDVDLVVLNRAPALLRFEVIRHGFMLNSRDDAARTEFHVRSFNEYMDFTRVLDTQHEYMKGRLKDGLFGERLWKKTRSA